MTVRPPVSELVLGRPLRGTRLHAAQRTLGVGPMVMALCGVTIRIGPPRLDVANVGCRRCADALIKVDLAYTSTLNAADEHGMCGGCGRPRHTLQPVDSHQRRCLPCRESGVTG